MSGLKQENEVYLENIGLLIISIYMTTKVQRESLQSGRRCGLRIRPQENQLLMEGQRKSPRMEGLRIKRKTEASMLRRKIGSKVALATGSSSKMKFSLDSEDSLSLMIL